jgi:TetR/AcrR family transcriptional regulator, transcriptional repressor for nem operon
MAHPRRKQPAITRKAILKAAGEGFSLHGYVATGISEIAERSGVTRGALFHHFADKQGLALAWIREEWAPALEDACQAGWEEVHDFSQWKSRCLSLLQGLGPSHPVALLHGVGSEWAADAILQPQVAAVLQAWVEHFAAVLARGQQEGWIHPSIQPENEAVLMVSQLCGVALMTRLDEPALVLRRAESSVAAYLDTLRGAE